MVRYGEIWQWSIIGIHFHKMLDPQYIYILYIGGMKEQSNSPNTGYPIYKHWLGTFPLRYNHKGCVDGWKEPHER